MGKLMGRNMEVWLLYDLEAPFQAPSLLAIVAEHTERRKSQRDRRGTLTLCQLKFGGYFERRKD
jgi:hypothetical protein